MTLFKSFVLAGILGGLAATANAATVVFEADLTISSIYGANGAGLTVGDTIHWEIAFDNGGGLENNSWTNADVVSATASSGSYQATFEPPYFPNHPVVKTDAAGNVTLMVWHDAFDDPDLDFDTVGGAHSVNAWTNGLEASDSSMYYYDYDEWLYEPSLWTGSVAAIPLPAGLPLLLAGLGGFALFRRRGS